MDIATTTAAERNENSATKALTKTKELGKDEFLKLLLTQLKYQDSQDPVKDKDFIAQMAQFSALEQTTNMTKSFEKVAKRGQNNEALSMLGSRATAVRADGGEMIEGRVTSIRYTDTDPEVTITRDDDTIAVVSLNEITKVAVSDS